MWRTKFGQYICQVITANRHVWTGWSNQPGYSRSAPLPMAHCVRCGREF